MSGPRPLTVNYGGMTRTFCEGEATYEFLLTHDEIADIGPKEGTIIVNATYCNINP